MRKINLKNWTLWRVVRLGMGIFFGITGATNADYILMFGGIFLIIHAVVNSCGVCATGSCEMPENSSRSKIS